MGQRSLLWREHREQKQTLAPPQGGFPHRPHVVLWLTDDQGWSNVGYHNPHYHTPNMDGLAKHGVTLERHYTFPWCAPSRASLMTGRMPHRGFQEAGQRVPRDVRMLSQLMRDAGYSTHHVGKWHLGLARAWQYPTSRGFDTSLGFMGGGVDYVSSRISDHALGDDWSCTGVDLQQNGGPATGRDGVFSGTWVSAEIDWAVYNRTQSKPMFLYVALQAMHSPTPGVEVLRPFMAHYKEQKEGPRFAVHSPGPHPDPDPDPDPNPDRDRDPDLDPDPSPKPNPNPNTNPNPNQASAALISHADELLGRLVRSLRGAGMWETTLVIHLSDNGGQVNWAHVPLDLPLPLPLALAPSPTPIPALLLSLSLSLSLSLNPNQVNWVEEEVQGNNWPLRGMKRSLFEGAPYPKPYPKP
jgi:arylsulfatase A-like enzyme